MPPTASNIYVSYCRQVYDVMTWLTCTFSALLACARETYWSPVNSPRKGPVTHSFDVFLCKPQQTVEQTLGLLISWQTMTLIWRRFNGLIQDISVTFWDSFRYQSVFLTTLMPIIKYRNSVPLNLTTSLWNGPAYSYIDNEMYDNKNYRCGCYFSSSRPSDTWMCQ